MLTIKENLRETISGGSPDRFVNQYEFMGFMFGGNPVLANRQRPTKGGPNVKNDWGVTYAWPANVPGGFPVHDEDHIVIKDITKWRDYLKAPTLDYSQEEWDKYKPGVDAINRNEVFATHIVTPGIFEHCHHLQGMDNALVNFYEEPEATKELIDYITDWEIKYAKLVCDNYHPDAVFHHDDWGSARSSFLSPQMFDEFIVPAFKKIYGTYKDNGVELIIHHSDSYAANLVPYMIEMGVDIWQGCITTNNVPELVKKYGGKIAFMGDIDNSTVDVENWTPELIKQEVNRTCENNGKHYFIPCIATGGPESVYPGVYDTITDEINRKSKELF